jgi:hypothetical protein
VGRGRAWKARSLKERYGKLRSKRQSYRRLTDRFTVVPSEAKPLSQLQIGAPNAAPSHEPKYMNANPSSDEDITLLRTLWIVALLVALVAFFSSCAYNKNLQPAQATPGTGEGGFELADANHDGKLSRDEASDFLTNQIFNAIDLDHNGQITKEEWSKGGARPMSDFKKRDTNHDGVVTREEALKYGRAHGMTKKAFAEADKNHDGALDRNEIESYYASREGSPR